MKPRCGRPTRTRAGARPRRPKHKSDRARKFRGQPRIAFDLIQFTSSIRRRRGRINKNNTAPLLQPHPRASPRTVARLRPLSPTTPRRRIRPRSRPLVRVVRQVRFFSLRPRFSVCFLLLRLVLRPCARLLILQTKLVILPVLEL
jgi:hypothetical protein